MNRPSIPTGSREEGFTLIEAMVAMVILLFGIAAVSNLMVIAGSTNTVANHATATTAAATRQMELLKSVNIDVLTAAPGGSVTADTGVLTVCGAAFNAASFVCNTPANEFQGIGRIHVRWSITVVGGAAPNTLLIQVAAESTAPAIGRRSRAFFTTLRTL
jgi:prepilin-type N-terminal cleavage/methylation domain-containing protein